MSPESWLELGRIGGPYGIKGWVHVRSYTSPPERLLRFRSWILYGANAAPAPVKVAEARRQGAGLVARLEGVEDRNHAATLQGRSVGVLRSELPRLRKGEFYQADLIGLAVENTEGVSFGRVVSFVQTPGGDVMVIRSARGQERWVPASRERLRSVDLAAGRIIVDWPAELE